MLWKFIDKKSPLWKNTYDSLENPIHLFYKKIDKMIGDLLDAVDDNTTVILLADHGFGPLYARININNFLLSMGYLKFNKNFWVNIKKTLLKYDVSLAFAKKLARKLGINNLREKFRDKKQQILGKVTLSLGDMDLSKTKAYSIGTYGEIYINMKGRDINGIVMPGREYENLRDEIIFKLKKIKDPVTGETILEEVFKKEDLFKGHYLDLAPDLMVLPKRGFFQNGSFCFTSKSIVETTDYVSATHEVEGGICVFSGNNIKKGKSLSRVISIMDIAPTVLYLLGVPIPDYFDGEVAKELVAENYCSNYPPEYEKIDLNSVYALAKDKSLTEKEMKFAKDLIENLGYLPKGGQDGL